MNRARDLLAALLLLSAPVAANAQGTPAAVPSAAPSATTVENGSTVKLEYTLKDDAGTVLDSNKGQEPLSRPLAVHLDQMGRDASRVTALAAVQVERVDALFADIIGRLEGTLDAVQSVVSKPAREGAAMWAALRAMLTVLRSRSNRGSRADDEDALFI